MRYGDREDGEDGMRKADQEKGRIGRRLTTLALGTLCVATLARPGIAQEDPEEEPQALPSVMAGTPAVVLPPQSARPTPGGAWPAGARTQEEALEAFEAELAFAFGEQRGAENFVLPDEVEARARRNPLARVNPARLAYRGLIRPPEPRAQIYEPLHSQLRRLGALFNARLVVLPLSLWFEPEEPVPAASANGEEPVRRDAERGGESHGAESASFGGEEPVAEPMGRAVLLFAVIDVRRSAVVFHGEFRGNVAELDSPTLLASLAFRVARQLSPS